MQRHWNTQNYYKKAGEGSIDQNYKGFHVLNQLSKRSKNILDVGCGEGTRLASLDTNAKKTGIDISKKAIELARKKHTDITFKLGKADDSLFSDNKFDLVYSAFVIEHVDNPEQFVNSMAKMVTPGGYLVILAPNYGAPNRCSPVFRGSRVKKLVSGFISDVLLSQSDGLNWNKVKPDKGKYFQDSDTTVEPFIRTLLGFIRNKGFQITLSDTLWEEELPNPKIQQLVFRFLARLKIYPFYHWGPHILVVGQKINQSKPYTRAQEP